MKVFIWGLRMENKKYKKLGTDRLGGSMPKVMDELEFSNYLGLNRDFKKEKWFGEKAIPIITKIVWYKKGGG